MTNNQAATLTRLIREHTDLATAYNRYGLPDRAKPHTETANTLAEILALLERDG